MSGIFFSVFVLLSFPSRVNAVTFTSGNTKNADGGGTLVLLGVVVVLCLLLAGMIIAKQFLKRLKD